MQNKQMTICENIPGSAIVAHWRCAARTASFDIVLSMWFQRPPCVGPWILSVMFLKWKGKVSSSPRFVFVILFTGVVLSTPGGVQAMAEAHYQLLCPMQYRLCCSILSLCLRKCLPGKFTQIIYSQLSTCGTFFKSGSLSTSLGLYLSNSENVR